MKNKFFNPDFSNVRTTVDNNTFSLLKNTEENQKIAQLVEDAKPLYQMSIEIDDQNHEVITLYKHSDPAQVARDFCNLHGLEDDQFAFLVNEIQRLLDKPAEKEEDSRSFSSKQFDGKGSKTNKSDLNESKINKYSETIEKMRKVAHREQDSNVFNKLYKDALVRRQYRKPVTREEYKEPPKEIAVKSGVPLNYGERLYYRGLKQNEKRDEEVEKQREEVNGLEHENCTFKPQITNIELDYQPRGDIKYRTLNYKEYKDKLISKAKDKHKIDEPEYAFQPTISAASKALAEKRPQVNTFYKLFRDNDIRRKNLQNLQEKDFEQYDFKPKSLSSTNYKPQQSFFQRIQNFVSIRAKRLEWHFKKGANYSGRSK